MASALLVMTGADTKEAKPVEGVNPGDFAPRIELTGNESIRFKRPDGCYTLVNFWAAYDAASRAQNVRLWNTVEKMKDSSVKVSMYSISFDERKSVFEETVKMDKLDGTTQLREEKGTQSDLFKKYKLRKGLRNFLINGDGVIVATNVTPERLTELEKQI